MSVSKQIAVYGAVSALGGIDGYFRKQSKASLIAGIACGGALLTASKGINNSQSWGKWLGLATTLALVIKFAPDYKSNRELYPAGLMTAFGLWVLGALIVEFAMAE